MPIPRPLLIPLLLLTAALVPRAAQAREDLSIWPNRVSKANSDPWLVAHHDRLRLLRPRLLVLNFVNGLQPGEARQKVDALIAALRESSRYHGYKDPKVPPFLEYQVDKIVDLTDTAPTPTPDGNSSRYPRVPNWKEGINFQYSQLFGPQFAAYYGYPDPSHPRQFLNLHDLVQSGTVNEVWFLARQGNAGAPLECVEVKQAYTPNFKAIPGKWVEAGNGSDPGQPFLGRSLRILFINAERGPGCAMESLGHALEGTCNSGAIPYFTRYFTEYAGFDLDKRFGLPFNTLYRRPSMLSYPDPHTLVYTDSAGKPAQVNNYYVIGGSVHFTPTARQDYDLDNPASVLSSIEDYRIGSGPGGRDVFQVWNDAVFKRYNAIANDCQGPWLVYWRQNMPGYHNRSRDDQHRPMKNWWPFLFY